MAEAQSRFGTPNAEVAAEPTPDPALPPPPTGLPNRSDDSEQQSARAAIAAFLRRAREEGIVDPATHERLRLLLDRGWSRQAPPWSAPSQTAAGEHVEETTPSDAPSVGRPQSTATSLTPAPPPPAPPSARPPTAAIRQRSAPAPFAVTAGRIWKAAASDFALHGFAYIGVVLTFVGVLGFLLYAFVDIPDAAQPFVELFIALIFFGWAWALHRQQAHRVAEGMSWIGKTLLPFILFAGLVDSAPFPPDFQGGGLVAALTLTAAGTAAVYAWQATRNPSSTLRFLVAPLLWLTALSLGFIFKSDEALAGDAITRLVSGQGALVAVAIAVTLVAALWRPEHRFAAPTVRSALVGLPVAYLMTISLAAAESWQHLLPLVVLGIATLASAEVLATWFERRSILPALRPVLLAGVVAPLVPAMSVGWAAVLIVAVYLALFEWTIRIDEQNTTALTLAGAGVAVGAAMSFVEPMSLLIVSAVLTIWAMARRAKPGPFSTARELLDVAAATFPIAVGYALVQLLDPGVAWLVMASVLAAATVLARSLGSTDPFWAYWPTLAAFAVAFGAVVEWNGGGQTDLLAVITVAVTSGVVASGPRWPIARLWMGFALASGTLALGFVTWDYQADRRAAAWALLGLALIVAALAWGRRPAGHLAAIGHLMTVGALLGYPGGTPGAVVAGGWFLGWLVSTLATESGRDSFSWVIERAARALDGEANDHLVAASRWLGPVLLASSASPAILVAAAEWPEFAAHRSWTGITLAIVSLLAGLSARLLRLRRPLGRVLAMAAIVNSVIGVAVTAPEHWPMIFAAAAIIGVAALLTGNLRAPGFVWFAWIVSVLLVSLLARAAGVPSDRVYLVTLAWAAAMLLGGLLLDDVQSGRRTPGEGLRARWLRYLVLIGAAVLPLSLGPIADSGPETFGWSALAAAAVYLSVALLLRIGTVTVPAYALAAVALGALSPWSLLDQPWRLVTVAGPLAVLSWYLGRKQPSYSAADNWLRWDTAPLVVAHLIGAFALVFSLSNDQAAGAALAFGTLSLAVGVWRQHRVWVDLGNLLILSAAAGTGAGWLSIAFAVTALRGLIGAYFSTGASRVSYHLVGAVSVGAGWISLGIHQGWTQAETVSYTALAYGALAISVTALSRFRKLQRDSARIWEALGVIGVAAAGIAALNPSGEPWIDGPWLAIGLGLVAVALELAADDLDWDVRLVSPLATGLAWVAVGFGYQWDRPQFVAVTALAFGALTLATGALGRLNRMPRSAIMRWGGLGAAGVALAALLSIDLADAIAWGPSVAVGIVMVAGALELPATSVDERLRYSSVATAGVAWLLLANGMGWNRDVAVGATVVAFGSLAVAIVEITRLKPPEPADPQQKVPALFVVRSWFALGVLGLLTAAAISAAAGEPSMMIWAGVAAGAAALSSARAARPLRVGWLREQSVVAGLAAITLLALGQEVADSTLAGAVLGIALGATLLTLMVGRATPGSAWLRPVVVLGVAANLEAGAFAAIDLPSTRLLVASLLAIGVQALATGITMDRPGILALGPPALGTAFILMIAENIGGSPQWFTIPLGLVVLAEVEIVRSANGNSTRDTGYFEIVMLEWLGIGLLATPPLVEMFTSGPAFGLTAFGIAALLLVWAAVTRLRRRAIAAASLALASGVLMLFAAAAGSAPDSAVFWIIAVGVGFSVMLVAASIEAYRSKKGRFIGRFDQLMEGWQ